MIKHKSFTKTTILILTFIVGLGLALVLPWLASSQIQAAQIEPGEEFSAPEAPAIYYVAITGTGSTGDSWENAFTNLQDALAAAVPPAEIWVAKGVYYPDIGSGQVDNERTSTFVMTDGVSLMGGFTFGDSDITDQDPHNNVTVLSGDIDWDNGGKDTTDGNGVVTTTSNITGDNAHHVVTAKWVTGTAVLDGFIITAGQANGALEPDNFGGGLYCDGRGSGNTCSPNLKNLVFSGNLAKYGGAMWNDGHDGGESHPVLFNVTFSSNLATRGQGGAMYNLGYKGSSSPELVNVVFSGNSARNDGGGMFNDGDQGESNPELINVKFSGNSAGNKGGAMYNLGYMGDSSPMLTNVTFSGNRAGFFGGAIYNTASGCCSKTDVRNSILYNNQDSSGTGTISASIYLTRSASITLTHSLVQGSLIAGGWIGGNYVDGGGNIDTDPMFVATIDPSTAPTTTGNLRLQENSPAIDKGDNSFITSIQTDLDGEARIVDGNLDGTPTVDMGAYEYQVPYIYEISLPLILN